MPSSRDKPVAPREPPSRDPNRRRRNAFLYGCVAVAVVAVFVVLFVIPYQHSYSGSLSGEVPVTRLNVPNVPGITVDVVWAVTGAAAVNLSIWTCESPLSIPGCPWIAFAYGTSGTFTFETTGQSNMNGFGYWLWCLELTYTYETLDFTVSYSISLVPL